MPGLKEDILAVVSETPGRTDREITNVLRGATAAQQAVNQACRELEVAGILRRSRRGDGLIGNYPTRKSATEPRRHAATPPPTAPVSEELSEDAVKERLRAWLETQGWMVKVAWGQARGADLEAVRGGERWIVEVKGCGSRQPMRVNYFLAVLGEILQRMDDPTARYSIAFPDMTQFRGLWRRFPSLAKERTTISTLFVATDGSVDEDR